MKIDRVVTIHDFCDPKGGATLLALEAAIGLSRRGYRSTFLTGDDGINPTLRETEVEVVPLGESAARDIPYYKSLAKGLYNSKASDFIREWIKNNDSKSTIYHVHNWGQILSPSILYPLNQVIDRLVISAHDFFHVCPNGSFSFLQTGKVCELKPMSFSCITANCDRKNYGFKLWRVARQSVRNAVFDTGNNVPILAIHDRMRPFFTRSGVPDAAVRTLPNPVRPFSLERIHAEENNELVFIGRLETTKGPDLAAAAARRAGVTIRFIGDGALRPDLEASYPEMMFDGFVPRAQIASKLSKARALIVASRYPEPYGLVVVEALWSGLPVIIADSAFLAQDVVEAGAGIAQSPQDEAGLANAMRMIFDDDELVHQMSQAALTRTRQLGNTPDDWLSALEAIYSERLNATGEPLAKAPI